MSCPARASVLLLALLTSVSTVSAQSLVGTDPGGSIRTRADLERLLGEYESALTSPAYSDDVKRTISADAERIRVRLRDGDFKVGDRIEVNVVGEQGFPMTVTVEPGPSITLDPFGQIGLDGVLRSEIAAHLTEAVGKYIRDPVVRATAQMRISVLGQVGTPGFYTMPAETVLSDALMLAGGPQGTADFGDMRIERAGQSIYQGRELEQALQQGLTLDQLNLEAGDQIVVPAQGSSIWRPVARYALMIGTFLLLGRRLFF